MVDGVTPLNELQGKPTKERPKQSKDFQRANINDTPRPTSSGDHGDYINEYHRTSTIEVHIINTGSQNRSIYEAEANMTNLTNNENTKKQFPNEMKGGSIRKNAN